DSGAEATTGMSYLGMADSVVTRFEQSVLDWLAAELTRDVDTTDAPPGFTLGLVGWLGYELRAETMGTPATRESRYPRAAWLRVTRCLAFDHERRQVLLLALVPGDAEPWTGEAGAWRAMMLERVREHPSALPP